MHTVITSSAGGLQAAHRRAPVRREAPHLLPARSNDNYKYYYYYYYYYY